MKDFQQVPYQKLWVGYKLSSPRLGSSLPYNLRECVESFMSDYCIDYIRRLDENDLKSGLKSLKFIERQIDSI